jgi:hypothetical protein
MSTDSLGKSIFPMVSIEDIAAPRPDLPGLIQSSGSERKSVQRRAGNADEEAQAGANI